MSDSFKYVQAQNFTLAGAGAVISDTTITLSSMTGIDGALLTMTDFGSIGYGTLEPNSGTQEEQISFSGITQNGNGTATLTGVKTVLFIAPYTETSGLAKTHAGGTTFIISNTSGFYNKLLAKDDDETITGLWNFPNNGNTPTLGTVYAAPTTDLQIASKKYVDDTVVFGAPLASTSTAGIVQTATQAQYDARTATGSTGALLHPTPALTRTVLTHDYIVSASGTDAYAISCSPAVGAYTAGDVYHFKADVANTGACTLAVNGLSPLSIKVYGANPRDNYIKAGSCVAVQYDGTNLQILSVSAQPSVSQDGAELYAADGGANDTYAITLVPAIAAYVVGEVFRFKANTVNTAGATLNVNGVGALTITRSDGSALADGDIAANQFVEVIVVDGSNCRLLSPVANSPKYSSGTITRDMTAANGAVTTAHGLGRTPRYIKITGMHYVGSAVLDSVGTYNGTTISSISRAFEGATGSTIQSSANIIEIGEDGGDFTANQAAVPTFDATNITLTWTKTGSPTGTASILWEAQA